MKSTAVSVPANLQTARSQAHKQEKTESAFKQHLEVVNASGDANQEKGIESVRATLKELVILLSDLEAKMDELGINQIVTVQINKLEPLLEKLQLFLHQTGSDKREAIQGAELFLLGHGGWLANITEKLNTMLPGLLYAKGSPTKQQLGELKLLLKQLHQTLEQKTSSITQEKLQVEIKGQVNKAVIGQSSSHQQFSKQIGVFPGQQQRGKERLNHSPGSVTVSFQTGRMNDVQQLIWRHTGVQNPQPNLHEQIVQKIEKIMAKGDWGQLSHGSRRFTVRLHPENLGLLRVSFVQSDQGVVAKIMAQTQATKDILQTQLGHLKHSLSQQALNVQRFDVTVASQETEFYQEQEHQGQQREEERELEHQEFEEIDHDEDETKDFQTWLHKEVNEHEN